MYRDLLITKEKMKEISTGNGYRQKDHETPTGGDTYENSVADDLELFYEDIKRKREPLSLAWTYFLPELTLEEMGLIENKDTRKEFMRNFKLFQNADVSEIEMQSSSSSAKYVMAYCRRRTIAIPSQDRPVANRESDSAVTNSERNLPDENQESNSANEVNSTPSIGSNVPNSRGIVEPMDPEITKPMSKTEGGSPLDEDHFRVPSALEPLLDQQEPDQEEPYQGETGSGRAEKMSVRRKLMLLFIVLVLVIGVTVGLSIYFTKTRDKESVLILSNYIRGSNLLVPMVIDLGATSTGKFHFYIISKRE